VKAIHVPPQIHNEVHPSKKQCDPASLPLKQVVNYSEGMNEDQRRNHQHPDNNIVHTEQILYFLQESKNAISVQVIL
jgi:hypothetical protein